MFRNFTQVVDHALKLETKDLIVVAPEDKPILIAINDAFQMGLIRPILVGNKKKILDLLMELGIRKDGYEIYNAKNSQDAALVGVKLVNKQANSILMKGHMQSQPFIDELDNENHGLKTNTILSHIGVLDIPNYHKLIFVSDAVMNVLPTLNENIEIIGNIFNFVKSLGIYKPKIAMISAIEVVNENIKSSVDAQKIVNKLKNNDDYYIGGPFAVDVAVSHDAAKTKKVNHVVAGDADILIFPNIESANSFYKSTTFFASSIPAALLIGASNPIIFTSRSDSYKSKLYSIALAVVSTDIL